MIGQREMGRGKGREMWEKGEREEESSKEGDGEGVEGSINAGPYTGYSCRQEGGYPGGR